MKSQENQKLTAKRFQEYNFILGTGFIMQYEKDYWPLLSNILKNI
jgi:hypothetical protein